MLCLGRLRLKVVKQGHKSRKAHLFFNKVFDNMGMTGFDSKVPEDRHAVRDSFIPPKVNEKGTFQLATIESSNRVL